MSGVSVGGGGDTTSIWRVQGGDAGRSPVIHRAAPIENDPAPTQDRHGSETPSPTCATSPGAGQELPLGSLACPFLTSWVFLALREGP